ncbi:helix-turn-helix domain-containing protein [Micromonospora sp. WMMD882]|uniref:helix-turn-helix domain-containing protein n=1 Tax=Micromonospora sp. WMMD882 TaxID=3015151 RepID=UPI00248AD8F3|nr:helix-turn-helix domain-containing protein [Micromonospora sp. WMMD882]WBB82480.1 helix-turn-helix domain-containing protein [Micromonospora sp. WMMD882]
MDRQELHEARQALGRKLAAWRKARQLIQDDLARQIPSSRSTVAMVERGRQVVDRIFWLQCEAVLDAQGELINAYQAYRQLDDQHRVEKADAARRARWGLLADSVTETGDPDTGPTTAACGEDGNALDHSVATSDADGQMVGPSGLEGDRQRQKLLASIAAVAAGSGLSGLTPSTTPRRVGAGDVARIEAITALYRSVDYEVGGGALHAEAGRFAEAASVLLASVDTGPGTASLATAVAGARQLAGWTAFDAGRHSDAGRHWLAAERTSVAAGNQLLAARTRYCQARQFQHLHHNQDALATVRLAHDQLGREATPALLAMLRGAEAASLAALGEHAAAVTALEQASGHFEDIDPDQEPDWMRFYDRGELLAQYGRVYRDLARHDRRHADRAVEWTQAAIVAFGPQNVRSTVLNTVGLCSALALAGEPDRAITVGSTVIRQAQRLTSRRVRDRVRNLARDISPDIHHSGMADFRHTVLRLSEAAA